MARTAQADCPGRHAGGGFAGPGDRRRCRSVGGRAIRGARLWRRADPDRRARSRRHRARRGGLRTRPEWRADPDGERVGAGSSRSGHYAGGPP